MTLGVLYIKPLEVRYFVDRKNEIVKSLRESGFLSVTALAAQFGASVSTIRRDLDELVKTGAIVRTHGGAMASHQAALADRPVPHLAEKRSIGAAMAERVLEGQTVFIDTGSTCVEVARHLTNADITVVTHDLYIGLEILKKPSINLVFIGGELLPTRSHMWGPAAVDQLDRIHVNVAVFGASSVMSDGVYTNSSYSLEVQRKIRSIANEAFFVADSSKFGREFLYKILGFEDFTAGITDSRYSAIRAAAFPIPLIRVPVSTSSGLIS